MSFKFLIGIFTGIYIAQAYPSEIPNVTYIVNGIKKDIKSKFIEYSFESEDNSKDNNKDNKKDKK